MPNEESTKSGARRRPSPSPSNLETAPLTSENTMDHLEISDRDFGGTSSRAPRPSSYRSRGLLYGITGFIFLVATFPYMKHHYAQEASSRQSLDAPLTKKDAGPHKRSHVFVKPGYIKDKNRGKDDEMVSDEAPSKAQQVAGGVPPKKGLAYLTPEEFASVRVARPEESVLLTGGLGFIGSHVVDLLLHRGFKVTILDDESNGHNHNKYCTEMVPHDITVVGDLPKFPTGEEEKDGEEVMYFTHVIHLAAAISVAESMTDPDKYERINYGGSQKVLDWIRGYNTHVSKLLKGGTQRKTEKVPTLIRKIVAASSAAIYGDPDPTLLPLREVTPYGGLSPYADTKYRMEGLMHGFVDSQNGDNEKNKNDGFVPAASATALRFFNVYGPRQDPKNPYSGVISLFLEMASNNKDITILGDGLMTRDFVYVKDVARAVTMALLQEKEDKEPASFSVYNVCTGKSITINELATQVKQSMEATSEIVHLDPRDGDIRDSRCNPASAAAGMNFVAAVTQEVGLEKTANWFREKDRGRLLRNHPGRRLEEQSYPELI